MSDYITHSPMSNPGQYAYLFDDLPTDVDALCRVVNNFFIHIWKTQRWTVPTKRKLDYATRTVEAVLKRALEYSDAPLTKQRPRQKQFIGDCRHAALLLCSMLRHQGIAARMRHGYCQYITDDGLKFNHHVITEYWNGERWVLEDPDIIRHDIAPADFLFGSQVWQQYRAGKLDDSNFYLTHDLKGAWTFPLTMLRDLASLAKFEATSSDSWGIIKPGYELTEADKVMLDDAAAMLEHADDLQAAMQTIYAKYPVLKVSQPLLAWDWAVDDMIEYNIEAEIA
jgi:hypothetical protein